MQVRPDLLVLGKALSGGVYPVSAVLGDDEVRPPCAGSHSPPPPKMNTLCLVADALSINSWRVVVGKLS